MKTHTLCLAALLGLFACNQEEIPDPIVEVPDDGKRGAGPDEAVDPSVFGPFQVGATSFTVTDPSRPDPETGEPRPLVVEVWYPAEDASVDLPREDYGLEDILTEEQIIQLGIDPAQEGRLPVNASRDPAPLREEGPYPLIIFSHGNGGTRVQSVFLTVHLASHGYVVAALDHPGNTLSDVIRTGQGFPPPDLLLQIARDRPEDVSFLIDHLLTRNDLPGDFFEGLIDPDEIGVTGHSFGAYTSLATSGLDARISASAPLAPPSTLALAAVGVIADNIPIDTLILAGGQDLTLPFATNQEEVFGRLPGGKRGLVNILAAGHFTFSDICSLDLERIAQIAGLNTEGILEDGCGPQNIDPARGHFLTNTFVTAFFNAELRDSFPSRLLLRDLIAEVDPEEVSAELDLSFPVAP